LTAEETSLYLEKARWHLASARTIAAQNIPEIAAREAYYGAFHAAQAYLFECSGKIAKTHTGVHGEFSRLAKDDPHIDKSLLPFLGQAYDYKSISDYEVGPLAQVYIDDALDVLERAEAFITCIEARVKLGIEKRST
jgi:uncharacterized protein (UPF0332 family)